jgi:hypothetical protein
MISRARRQDRDVVMFCQALCDATTMALGSAGDLGPEAVNDAR